MRCYILVGGRSRRMGASKIRLFLGRVADAARPVFDEVVAVHRPDGEPLAELRSIFEAPHDGAGPIFGIARALHDANARAFILAVDYPLITSDVLRYLSERGGVPVWGGRAQPLCAAYDPSLLPLLDQRVAAGKLDVFGLLEEARVEMIGEGELRARFAGDPLMNVNTPDDLEKAGALDGR